MVICKITEGQNDLTNSGLARLQPSGKQTQRTCAKCRHKAPAASQEVWLAVSSCTSVTLLQWEYT